MAALGREINFFIWACFCLATISLVHGQKSPPEIKEPAVAEVRWIFKNNPHTEECKADGNPTPLYEWRKDGQVLKSTSVISVNEASGELKFTKFDEEDQGEYMCIASNTLDWVVASAMSPPITMMANILDDFIQSDTKTVSGDEYAYLKLECANKGFIQVERPIYSWYNEEISAQLNDDGGRRFVDEQGNLHLAFLTKGDEDVTTYRCGVSNQKSNINLGSPTKIDVNEKENPASAIAPTLQHSNDGLKAALFSDTTLECFFSGYDPGNPKLIPTTKWFDDASNEIFPGDRYEFSDNDRKLTIKNIQELDEKYYYCMGSNSGGDSKKQGVLLDITSAPIFEDGGKPQSLTKPELSEANFNCKARSLRSEKEPDAPVWYINAKPFETSGLNPSKYFLNSDKTVLTIKDIEKPADFVCVQCMVKNEYGSTWGDACLTVILPITLSREPPNPQEIKRGESVDLTIVASTDPSATLSYKWEFRNKTYEVAPPFVTYDPVTFEAYINTSDLNDEQYQSIAGVYRRIIYHTNDQKIVEIEVILEDPPLAAAVADGGIDMWVVGLIIGILFLLIVIIIIIFVICRKKQEGDYNVDKKETGAGLDPEKELKEKGFDDYSRPTYDDYEYPEKKPRGELEYDDVPIGGDDESLAEYGDEADMHFNEDGSFIGVYQNNKNGNKPVKSTESTI